MFWFPSMSNSSHFRYLPSVAFERKESSGIQLEPPAKNGTLLITKQKLVPGSFFNGDWTISRRRNAIFRLTVSSTTPSFYTGSASAQTWSGYEEAVYSIDEFDFDWVERLFPHLRWPPQLDFSLREFPLMYFIGTVCPERCLCDIRTRRIEESDVHAERRRSIRDLIVNLNEGDQVGIDSRSWPAARKTLLRSASGRTESDAYKS